jgi:hypothetical protein
VVVVVVVVVVAAAAMIQRIHFHHCRRRRLREQARRRRQGLSESMMRTGDLRTVPFSGSSIGPESKARHRSISHDHKPTIFRPFADNRRLQPIAPGRVSRKPDVHLWVASED